MTCTAWPPTTNLDRADTHAPRCPKLELKGVLGDRHARLSLPVALRDRLDTLNQALDHQITAAAAIERCRHTVLGLPYGTPAAPLTGPATHAALGPPPDNPADARQHAELAQSRTTLEYGPYDPGADEASDVSGESPEVDRRFTLPTRPRGTSADLAEGGRYPDRAVRL